MNPLPFGQLHDGAPVEAFQLVLPDGVSAQIITLGATITSLRVPDRNGRLADVVLGFDNLADYLEPHPYFGAIAGRVAGRISAAKFTLDGETHSLAANDPPNHLHGGIFGLSRRNWSGAPLERADGNPSVCFNYQSPHGEDGYPGNLDIKITYTLTKDHSLIVDTEARSDRATPFSPTQHSYFNLAGEGRGDIKNHQLQINADTFAPADEKMGLLGQRHRVVDGANDLRSLRRIGDAIPNLHKNHGDLYFLRNPEDPASSDLFPSARIIDPGSGRTLTVRTNEACLQLYTGVGLDGSFTGKSGIPYGPYSGFCLECEGYPDGANTPSLGGIILRPGRAFHRTTHYDFSITG